MSVFSLGYCDLAPCFGDLSQSETLYEIKKMTKKNRISFMDIPFLNVPMNVKTIWSKANRCLFALFQKGFQQIVQEFLVTKGQTK